MAEVAVAPDEAPQKIYADPPEDALEGDELGQ